MELISDESSFSKNSREEDEGRVSGGNWLLWLAAIAVLAGLNFASWSFCMWVFGQPEHPLNYKLLTKMEKLDPIVGFTPTTAPRGKFHSAKDLYAKVYPFDDTELAAYNGILKRHFIKSYYERDDVTFFGGDFVVVSSRALTEDDIFPVGLTVRAQANTFPDAFVDLVLPGNTAPNVFYQPGENLTVEESSTCAAVLNVDRDENDVMIFTVVPLVERDYVIAPDRPFTVKLQPTIQLGDDKWPVSDGEVSNPIDSGEEGPNDDKPALDKPAVAPVE